MPTPLVELTQPANERAFRDAAVACLDGLYSFALMLSHDSALAEDLVQETYVRALRAHHRPAPDAGLRSWMFAILHNVWRNEVRRRHPASLTDHFAEVERLASREPDPLQAVDRLQTGGRLAQAIAALPAPFREAIILHCVEGFSYREMAEIVGCPAGTVMSRLARGRALLRRSLGPLQLVASAGGRR